MTDIEKLTLKIRDQVNENKGFISFDGFMAAALYEPGLGYYESAEVFGDKGDFVTGTDLGPWLALGFADLLIWGWESLGRPERWSLLEQGSGSGRLLADVLQLLHEHSMPRPSDIIVVERSAHMRKRQRERFDALGLSIRHVESLDGLETPTDPVLMFSNELPDAFPVRCFVWRNGNFFERGVGLDGNRFVWMDAEQPLADPPEIEPSLVEQWPEGYIGEWNPGLAAWQASVARAVGYGYVFTVDYGYRQSEYYRPGRLTGTLLGHAGHRTNEYVLEQPGSMDITAHVDFTALAKAGQKAGLEPVTWLTQGAWLAQSPSVQQAVAKLATSGKVDDIAMLAHAKRMLLPFGMGESFKLLIQSCGSQTLKPDYLQQFDKLSTLQV